MFYLKTSDGRFKFSLLCFFIAGFGFLLGYFGTSVIHQRWLGIIGGAICVTGVCAGFISVIWGIFSNLYRFFKTTGSFISSIESFFKK
jgi:hypothetical protein